MYWNRSDRSGAVRLSAGHTQLGMGMGMPSPCDPAFDPASLSLPHDGHSIPIRPLCRVDRSSDSQMKAQQRKLTLIRGPLLARSRTANGWWPLQMSPACMRASVITHTCPHHRSRTHHASHQHARSLPTQPGAAAAADRSIKPVSRSLTSPAGTNRPPRPGRTCVNDEKPTTQCSNRHLRAGVVFVQREDQELESQHSEHHGPLLLPYA